MPRTGAELQPVGLHRAAAIVPRRLPGQLQRVRRRCRCDWRARRVWHIRRCAHIAGGGGGRLARGVVGAHAHAVRAARTQAPNGARRR